MQENGSKYSNRELSSSNKKMNINVDGVSLELPFTPNILEDDFRSYIASLIIANTKISFNADGFDDDMFPIRDNCVCD